MKFKDVVEIRNGRNQHQVENYPIYGSGGEIGRADDYICEAGTVVIGRKGSINNPLFVDEPFWNVDTAFGLVANKEVLLPKYLFYFCKAFDFESLNTTVTIPSLTKSNLQEIEIKLPSVASQQNIVKLLDGIWNLIELQRFQLGKLDEVVKSRFSSKRVYQEELLHDGIPFLRISDLNCLIDNTSFEQESFISYQKYNQLAKEKMVPSKGDLLITSRGTLGRCYVIRPDDNFYFQDGMISWLHDFASNVRAEYIAFLFQNGLFDDQIANMQLGATVSYLSIKMLKSLMVKVPSLVMQDEFLDFLHQVDKSKYGMLKRIKSAMIELVHSQKLVFVTS